MGQFDKYKITGIDFKAGLGKTGSLPVTSRKFNELVGLIETLEHPKNVLVDTIDECTLNAGVLIEDIRFENQDIYLDSDSLNRGRLFFDQDEDTYMTASNDNNVVFYSNGNYTWLMNAAYMRTQINNFQYQLNGLGSINFDADHDTYFRSVIDDELDLYVGARNTVKYTEFTSEFLEEILISDRLRFGDGKDMLFGTGTGTQIGTATAHKFAFWGATPVTQPGTITQTYATTSATHAARTAAALTDNGGGAAADGTIAVITNAANAGSADVAPVADAIAELSDQISKLVTDQTNTAQVLNDLIDKLQTVGLIA
jgi:hypothetical protein